MAFALVNGMYYLLPLLFILLLKFSVCFAADLTDYEIVNFDLLPKVEEDHMTTKDVARVIPYNKLNTGDTGDEVNRKILDQSVNSFLKSDYVQNSGVGKAAKQVEDGVRTDIAFGDPDSKIKHKVSVQYQAFQQEARLKYSGLTNVDFKYKLDDATYVAQWIHRFSDKELVFAREVRIEEEEAFIAHSTGKSYRSDTKMVSVRWNW